MTNKFAPLGVIGIRSRVCYCQADTNRTASRDKSAHSANQAQARHARLPVEIGYRNQPTSQPNRATGAEPLEERITGMPRSCQQALQQHAHQRRIGIALDAHLRLTQFDVNRA